MSCADEGESDVNSENFGTLASEKIESDYERGFWEDEFVKPNMRKSPIDFYQDQDSGKPWMDECL